MLAIFSGSLLSRHYLIAFLNCVYLHLVYKCGLVFVRVQLFPFSKILEYSSISQNRAVSVSLLSNSLICWLLAYRQISPARA
jgi:hypothetical protein